MFKIPNLLSTLNNFFILYLIYVNYLKFKVLAPLCTSSKPTPWSNSKLEDKEPTQYWFSTKRLPVLTSLHGVWYKEIEGKFIKVLPYNIEELLTPIALAHTHTTIMNRDG